MGSCTSPVLAEEEVEAGVARFCCMPWRIPGSSAGLVSPGISAPGLVRPEAAACCRTAWERRGAQGDADHDDYVIINSCSAQYRGCTKHVEHYMSKWNSPTTPQMFRINIIMQNWY